MRFLSILILFSCHVNILFCQLQDNFSDGNLSSNPVWIGDISHFVVNANQELQLMAPAAGVSKLFTQPVEEQDTTYWKGKIKMDFAPSATNFVRYYLQLNDTSSTASGYYLEIGENGTNDAIKFYRLDLGIPKLIGSCKTGAMANQPAIVNYEIKKVNGNWEFYTDYSGGINLTKDSSFVDNQYFGTDFKWTGFYCLYTDTRKDKFFFDDIYIGGPINDKIPPQIADLQLIDNKTIKLIFDEPLNAISASNILNYSVDNGIGNPITANLFFEKEITLTFANPFQSFTDFNITINNVSDLKGNAMIPKVLAFKYQIAESVKPFDLVINEIMADPTPVVGLPEVEYLELYNRSDKYLNLNNINIVKGTTNYKLPNQIVAPKSYTILCDDGVASQFSTFGNVAPMVTFPSLTNTGDKLILIDTTGKEIHFIQYSDAWYGSTLKKNGGYSLELKNPDNICDLSSNNWSGSNDFSGGTPGKANSILTTNNTIYEVKNVKINSNKQIQINFSKLLNSSLLSIANFMINGTNANISTITVDSSVVTIDLKNPLIGDGKFELQMNDIYNCDGKENITIIAEFYLEKPFVQALKLLSDKQVQIDFSIDMQNASLQNSSNYSIDQSIGAPSSINILANNSIVLNFNKALISGLNYNLQIKNVLSSFETTLKDTIFTIKYFTPSAINSYDLLINEIMADPSPTIGLPDAEYIEIYKNTSNYINLKDLKLIVGSNEFILPDYDFKGNTTNYVVIFTNKTGLDFGTNDTLSLAKNLNLTNDGTSISIVSSSKIIDAVNYSISDYQDSKKAEGGWSLERIFSKQPCRLDSLFIASKNLKGGTPGALNNVNSGNISTSLPSVLNVGLLSANRISVQFSTKINPSDLILNNFSIDNGLLINELLVIGQGEAIEIGFNANIEKNKIYTLTITKIEDCVGNKNQSPIVLKIANPEVPKVNELVINEILYDPNTGGVDFVEIYNNSQKVFDLKSVKIANIDDSQQDIKSIDQSKLIFPGDFIVLTSDNIDIKNRYTVKNPSNLVETKLPSFNDGAGNVSLLVTNPFGFQIIDSINYSDEMHAPLLNITSGVSLERINPNGQTSNRNNWHSAASTAGYGTPTYQNSQYFDLIPTKSDSTFSLPIVTFSPDGDGYNDYLTISIKTDKPDYQATIFVFDANGRLVKKLLDKQFISSADNIIWQGETDGDAAAPIGIYVLDCRLQHSDGTLKHVKLTCVLAKKLE